MGERWAGGEVHLQVSCTFIASIRQRAISQFPPRHFLGSQIIRSPQKPYKLVNEVDEQAERLMRRRCCDSGTREERVDGLVQVHTAMRVSWTNY